MPFPAVSPVRGLAAPLLALSLVLAGCSGLPAKPATPTQYDLGLAKPSAPAAAPTAAQPAIALADIQAAAPLEGSTAVFYRLAYANAQELRAYSQARWSEPPADLVQQRLRAVLGQQRVVLSAENGRLPPQLPEGQPRVLRLALEEFSQVFAAPGQSVGWVQLRATVAQIRPTGERLIGQRLFTVQQPAARADAAAGIQALSGAVDRLALELDQWLQQLPPSP